MEKLPIVTVGSPPKNADRKSSLFSATERGGAPGIRRPLEEDLGGQCFATRAMKMGLRTSALAA